MTAWDARRVDKTERLGMSKTADAVIIGGGALGASVFYHLTRLGMRDVALLEKGELASGSTGDSAAFVRQHYSNEVSIRLVRKSLEFFQAFPDEFDGAEVFTSTGWLFLVPPEAADVFDVNIARLRDEGVKTWPISVEDAAEELPGLNTDGIARVAFEPESGYVDPGAMVRALASKGEANGGEVRLRSPATGIAANGNANTVSTPGGDVEARVVVNAAGPWAGEVGRWMGLDLPLELSREQDIVVRPPADAPKLRRCVSNMVDRTYIRPTADGNVLIGTGHPKENEPVPADSYRKEADEEFARETSRLLGRRFPALGGSAVAHGWAGLYTITPDWNMILDRSPANESHYLAVGGSGHSFKLAPAMGQCLAEMIVEGEARTVDISPLRAGRFDDGAALRSTYGGNRA